MKLNHEEDWKNIFSDLPENQARHYMNLMPNHSTISFSGRLSYPGYLHIPTTYLLTEGDKIIPPEGQEAMIEMVKGLGGEVKVVRTSAGHAPSTSESALPLTGFLGAELLANSLGASSAPQLLVSKIMYRISC